MQASFFQDSKPASKSKVILVSSIAILSVVCLGTLYLYRSESPVLSLIHAEEAEFRSYVSSFSKSYSSESEYAYRFQVFRDNLVFIRIQNQRDSTLTLGVTPFSDMTATEFKEKYLFSRQVVDEPTDSVQDIRLNAPSQVDWRTKGAVTPVKDQGQCGSCWAFSATGGIESAWIIAGHSMVTLSEQQLMDCSNSFGDHGCSGGFYRNAYSYVISNKGITSEANYPYLEKNGVCNQSKASQVVASISSKYNVPANNPTALINAVAQQPTSVSVEADQALWQHYTSGTVTSGCGTNLDHDILAVGYNNAVSTPYWIVKNSWGTSWGMAGYIQIAITTGNGVCGINMTPGYPVV